MDELSHIISITHDQKFEVTQAAASRKRTCGGSLTQADITFLIWGAAETGDLKAVMAAITEA